MQKVNNTTVALCKVSSIFSTHRVRLLEQAVLSVISLLLKSSQAVRFKMVQMYKN